MNLNLNDLKFTISDLEGQKNQLKIEKSEIEAKYSSLIKEHRILKKQVEKFNIENIKRFEDKSEFSKKIERYEL